MSSTSSGSIPWRNHLESAFERLCVAKKVLPCNCYVIDTPPSSPNMAKRGSRVQRSFGVRVTCSPILRHSGFFVFESHQFESPFRTAYGPREDHLHFSGLGETMSITPFVKMNKIVILCFLTQRGELAQMVERSLSMREVPGSIPGFSTFFLRLINFPILPIVSIFAMQTCDSSSYTFLAVKELNLFTWYSNICLPFASPSTNLRRMYPIRGALSMAHGTPARSLCDRLRNLLAGAEGPILTAHGQGAPAVQVVSEFKMADITSCMRDGMRQFTKQA